MNGNSVFSIINITDVIFNYTLYKIKSVSQVFRRHKLHDSNSSLTWLHHCKLHKVLKSFGTKHSDIVWVEIKIETIFLSHETITIIYCLFFFYILLSQISWGFRYVHCTKSKFVLAPYENNIVDIANIKMKNTNKE